MSSRQLDKALILDLDPKMEGWLKTMNFAFLDWAQPCARFVPFCFRNQFGVLGLALDTDVPILAGLFQDVLHAQNVQTSFLQTKKTTTP